MISGIPFHSSALFLKWGNSTLPENIISGSWNRAMEKTHLLRNYEIKTRQKALPNAHEVVLGDKNH